MSSTNPGAETALLTAAEALPSHFSAASELAVQPLTALQATTMSLPGGAFAVESVTKGDTGVGAVILIITGLVDHANGEVFSRDEARTLWSAALTEVLTGLGEGLEGTFTPGQVHMTDAFDALDNADEAQVVGLFQGQTLACLLLSMPTEGTGTGAAAQLAAAVAEATAELEDDPTAGDDDSAAGDDAAQRPGAAEESGAATGPVGEDGAAAAPPAAGDTGTPLGGLNAETVAAQAVAAGAVADAAGPVLTPAQLQPLTGALAYSVDPRRIDLLRDVMMGVSVELGRTRMSVQDILGLTPGAIIELDRAAGAPVDVLVNGKLIAHGEVVVLDEEFAVRISEVVSPDREGRVSA